MMPYKRAKTSSPATTYAPLPKKVNRAEAKVDGKVAERLTKLHKHKNWALEVKLKGNRLARHQKQALLQVEDGKFMPYKLPDDGRRQPFDYFYLGDADAIVCVVDGKKVHCEVNQGVTTYDFQI